MGGSARGTTGRDTISGAHDPDFILREDFIQNIIRVPKSVPFVKYCIFKIILEIDRARGWLALARNTQSSTNKRTRRFLPPKGTSCDQISRIIYIPQYTTHTIATDLSLILRFLFDDPSNKKLALSIGTIVL
jgi:hypothetical protein